MPRFGRSTTPQNRDIFIRNPDYEFEDGSGRVFLDGHMTITTGTATAGAGLVAPTLDLGIGTVAWNTTTSSPPLLVDQRLTGTASVSVSGGGTSLRVPALKMTGVASASVSVGTNDLARNIRGRAPDTWFRFNDLPLNAGGHVPDNGIIDTKGLVESFYVSQSAFPTSDLFLSGEPDTTGSLTTAAPNSDIVRFNGFSTAWEQAHWLPGIDPIIGNPTGYTFLTVFQHIASGGSQYAEIANIASDGFKLTYYNNGGNPYLHLATYMTASVDQWGDPNGRYAWDAYVRIPAFSPHLLIVVWDVVPGAGAGEWKVYLDGTLRWRSGVVDGLRGNFGGYNGRTKYFGGGSGGTQVYDEMAIWTLRALAPVEVAELWEAAQGRMGLDVPKYLATAANPAVAAWNVDFTAVGLTTKVTQLAGTASWTFNGTLSGDAFAGGGSTAVTFGTTGTLSGANELTSVSSDPSLMVRWAVTAAASMTVQRPAQPVPSPDHWELTLTSAAASGATTLAVEPATVSMPYGGVLYYGSVSVMLTAPVNIGDTVVQVTALPASAANGTQLFGFPPAPPSPGPGSPPAPPSVQESNYPFIKRRTFVMPAPTLDGKGQPT